MLFNSFVFALFLPIVFILYWLLQRRSLRWQNVLLLVASYIFYGWWDWRFLSLIFFSSIVDFIVGSRLRDEENQSNRKILLIASLAVNLGLLGFFKYFDFFIGEFGTLLETFGLHANVWTLRVILPVGISFYTFQTLSCTIDIYRRKLEPTRDPIAFFAFVSFFPQLVAGPIERASNLLPQFEKKRSFDSATAKDGLRQMLWGLFKKVVIADNIALFVNLTFDNYANLSGIQLAVGVFLFAIQIYCDFSGYSDIAIGVARLFGFSLMRNFAFPYYSRDIAEFWRRWHISLSSWFRDYVYIPLGGSYVSKGKRIRNIIITFTVSGFWHGANWTFIVWGLLNGLYYIPIMLSDKQKKNTDTVAEGKILPSISEAFYMLLTFAMALLAWVFFRSETLMDAFAYIYRMFTTSWLVMPTARLGLVYAFVLLIIEWFQRDKQHGLEISNLHVVVRWAIYITLLIILGLVGDSGEAEFIYFQF